MSDFAGGFLAIAGTCLTLGLTLDEVAVVWAHLQVQSVPFTVYGAYEELARAIHAVKPSALPPGVLESL